MAVGLEVRAPFLDHELVEFANALPASYKLKRLKTKYILKKLMADKLPKEIVSRTKKGFGMPVASWLRNELKDFTLDLLSPERLKRQGIFNPAFVSQLLNEHFTAKKDHRKLLWTLLVFQMWQEKWYNN